MRMQVTLLRYCEFCPYGAKTYYIANKKRSYIEKYINIIYEYGSACVKLKFHKKIKVDLLPFYSTSSVKQNSRVNPHTKVLFFIYSYAKWQGSCVRQPGDFAIPLVNFVRNLPNGQVRFFGEFKLQKNCNQSCPSKFFFRQVETTFGLVLIIRFSTCKVRRLNWA